MGNNKRFAIVVPTNRILHSWHSYAENFKKFDHLSSDVKLFVVDDYSPFVSENLKILKEAKYDFEYWTIDMQVEFFKKNFGSEWEKFWCVIPHKTDACRSFGYVVAGLWGADVIITYDDDNWAINEESFEFDYIGGHDIVNSHYQGLEVSSSNRWFNTISMLETDPPRQLYARGFPYSKRGSDNYEYHKAESLVLMNVGLWIGNPDVDAMTVLSEGSLNGLPKTRTIGLKKFKRILLSKDLFAPLNTANTAYSKKLLPVVYDTFQGVYVGELKLDRFGDIWCNLFVKKVLDSVGGSITLGIPLVEHKREPRDTFMDFMKEFWGIIISERLFSIVEGVNLTSKSYSDAYLELASILETYVNILSLDRESLKKYFDKLVKSMRLWVEMLDRLGLT